MATNSTGVNLEHPIRLKQVPDNQLNCCNNQRRADSPTEPSSPSSSGPHLDVQFLEGYVGRSRSSKTIYSGSMPFSIYDLEVQDQAQSIETARNPNEQPTTSSQTTLDSALCRLKTSVLAASIQKSGSDAKHKLCPFSRVCPPPTSPPQLSRLITQRSLKHRRLHPYSSPPQNFCNATDNISNLEQPIPKSTVVAINLPFTAPTPTFIATFNVTNYATGGSVASPPPESGYVVNDQSYASGEDPSDAQLPPSSGEGAASPIAVPIPTPLHHPLLSQTEEASCANGVAVYEDGRGTYKSGGPVIISYQSLHGSDSRATPFDQCESDCDISTIQHSATIKREVKDLSDIGSTNLKSNLSLEFFDDEKVELEETGNIFDILACKQLY